MPTTPNPTSGFLFFAEKDEVTILDLTVEEAAKLVISAGLVTPRQMREANTSISEDDDTLSMLIAHPDQVLRPAPRSPKKDGKAQGKSSDKKADD